MLQQSALSQSLEFLDRLLNKVNPNVIVKNKYASTTCPDHENSDRTTTNTTLLMLYMTPRRPQCGPIELLLKFKADIHAKDAHGESVLTSLTFRYKALENISTTLTMNFDELKALLNGGIDLEYVNPQLQEKNPKIKKQLQGLSDYERLSVNPEARKIVDQHRLEVAQTCLSTIKKMEESTELPMPLKRIIGGYLMDYPLINKFPLSEQEIRSESTQASS